MVTPNYQQHKKEVLDIYNSYREICEMLSQKPEDGIVREADKIRRDIFNLMILGEAKSGKSTFINAFLGCEVVPMDVRQCTSAIITIRHGEEFTLVAKKAAGDSIKKTGYEAITRFLKKHAAIPDEYRKIPIAAINNKLLIPHKGNPIPPRAFDRFLASVQEENTYGLSPDQFEQCIRAYIASCRSTWKDIITKIEITYKLPESMQGIAIIDSPGVGASGYIGKITEDYIEQANAIIFVKSLVGQAIESAPFQKFLQQNCQERKKENLFLAFTGKSNYTDQEFDRLKEQALTTYENSINREKIIFVDSKVQLFLNHCRSLKTSADIEAYFDLLDKEGNAYDPVINRWYRAKGNITAFEESLSKASNFQCVHDKIERFARGAHYLQLIDFLDAIGQDLNRHKSIYSKKREIVNDHLQDSDALKRAVDAQTEKIIDIYNKLHEGLRKVEDEFTTGSQSIEAKAKSMGDDYKKRLESFRRLDDWEIGDGTFNKLRTITLNAINEAQSFRDKMAKEVIATCNKELIRCIEDPKDFPPENWQPIFTGADFDRINEETKAEHSGYTPGKCFSRDTRYYHKKDHIAHMIDVIEPKLFNTTIPQMKANLYDYLDKCVEAYTAKLNANRAAEEKAYNELVKKQLDNDSLLEEFNKLQEQLFQIEACLEHINAQRKELKNYAG